jgi:hypothetical protein
LKFQTSFWPHITSERNFNGHGQTSKEIPFCGNGASNAICTLVCNVDLPAAWLLYDEFSFAFHGYCKTAYGLDSAIENRPIGHLANVKYKVNPEIAIIYRGPTLDA